jgi:hypothetical protein
MLNNKHLKLSVAYFPGLVEIGLIWLLKLERRENQDWFDNIVLNSIGKSVIRRRLQDLKYLVEASCGKEYNIKQIKAMALVLGELIYL